MIYELLNRADEWTNEGGVGYWLVTHPVYPLTFFGVCLIIYIILVRIDEKEHRKKNRDNETERQEARKVKYGEKDFRRKVTKPA